MRTKNWMATFALIRTAGATTWSFDMDQKKKWAVCGFFAGILSWFGVMATPISAVVPAPWGPVVVAGGEAAKLGAEHIRSNIPDAGK